jgi:hypothetical protein
MAAGIAGSPYSLWAVSKMMFWSLTGKRELLGMELRDCRQTGKDSDAKVSSAQKPSTQ